MLPRAGAFLTILGAILVASAGARAEEPGRAVSAPANGDARVRVHVNAPRPVTLDHRTKDTPWQPVCESPCDTEVPVEGRYRITGDGVHRSRPFRLAPSANGQVTLDVDPGSSAAHAGGVVMLIAGIPAAAVGAILVIVGVAVTNKGTTEAVGAFTLLGGAGLTVAGVVLVGNNSTGVTQSPEVPLPSTARLPTFVPTNELPTRGTSVPIVSWSF